MRARIAVVLLLTGLAAMPAAAGSATAQVAVSVQVVARTLMTVSSQPSSVEVTAADVARGYIDVPQAVAFQIHSNASNGYSLQFEPLNSPFQQATVQWGSAIATVGTDGAWISHPYQLGTSSESMSVRLTFAPGTQPGSYSWPLTFSANSL